MYWVLPWVRKALRKLTRSDSHKAGIQRRLVWCTLSCTFSSLTSQRTMMWVSFVQYGRYREDGVCVCVCVCVRCSRNYSNVASSLSLFCALDSRFSCNFIVLMCLPHACHWRIHPFVSCFRYYHRGKSLFRALTKRSDCVVEDTVQKSYQASLSLSLSLSPPSSPLLSTSLVCYYNTLLTLCQFPYMYDRQQNISILSLVYISG
jgi:hypothetical protein